MVAQSPSNAPECRGPAAQPIFVVGMNGSGTTMMLDCLGRHPELYEFTRETRLLPHFIANLHQYGDLGVDENFFRLWTEFCQVPVFLAGNGGQPPPIPDDWKTCPRGLASVIDGVYRYFAQQAGKVRWIEKTPMNVLHMEELGNVFPHAKFIHMIRDGRDCAASFHRRWSYHPARTLYRWKNVVREGRRQGQRLGDRYFELRYEDLTKDPEQWMRRVCEFLGVEFTNKMLQSRGRHLESAAGDDEEQLGIVQNSGKWSTYFNPKALAALERIAGRVLRDCGYEVVGEAGDVDPPRWQQKVWLARDFLQRGIDELKAQLRGEGNRSWRLFWAHIASAVKQRRTTKF